MSHGQRIIEEFTHQSERFNAAPVYTTAETLQALVDLLPLTSAAHWLEVACGPGIVSRAIAPRVGSIVGVDLTPAMVEVAAREAERAGLSNARYMVGDATALDLAEACVDGAVTRFSLHHIPLPGRVVAGLARVVRPGGWICLADHITSEDSGEMAWHQEIERLRDPSHWACLTPAMLLALGERAGLVLRDERRVPFSMSFGEWLSRGSGGPGMEAEIRQALALRPTGATSFRVTADPPGERLDLVYHLSLWQRPA
jgi:SAM-dependent methyltransferase